MLWTTSTVLRAGTLSFVVGAWLAFLIPVSGALGVMLTIFPGVMLIAPLYIWAGERNGAAFLAGDKVMILKKRHRGQVVTVYEVWSERGQVRVRLGNAEERDCRDVFCYFEICRIAAVEERGH